MPIYETIVDLIPEKSITNKGIVLDIDNTLLYATDGTQWMEKLNVYRNPKLIGIRDRVFTSNMVDVVTPTGKGELVTMSGILRPDVKEFIAFCFAYFRVVCIWSAGKEKYVHKMTDILTSHIPNKPNLIFSYYQCDRSNGDIVKPLNFIYETPGMDEFLSPENTLVLDDRESTFSRNPENGIMIPLFEPQFTVAGLTRHDNALRQLMNWLLLPEVINCEDVRTLDKSSIFNLEITKPLEAILLKEIREPINIEMVKLLEIDDPEIMEIMNNKNYNTKKITHRDDYFGYKFLNT